MDGDELQNELTSAGQAEAEQQADNQAEAQELAEQGAKQAEFQKAKADKEAKKSRRRRLILVAIFSVMMLFFSSAGGFAAGLALIGLRLNGEPAPASAGSGGILSGSCGIPNEYSVAFNYGVMFIKAKKSIDTPASLVAAIYSVGEHSGYSTPFKTIDAAKNPDSTAQGPFQFLNGTWYGENGNRGYQIDCGGEEVATSMDQITPDGNADRNNIYDSACAAAWMLGADMDSQSGTVNEKAKKAIGLYRRGGAKDTPETTEYINRVYNRYIKYTSCLSTPFLGIGSTDIVQKANEELTAWNNGTINASRYNGGSGDDWCADFVNYVYNAAHYPINSNNHSSLGMKQSFENKTGRIWLQYNGTTGPAISEESKLLPGDVYVVDKGGNLGHTGIIISVSGNSFKTIEGNAGGGKVKQENYDNFEDLEKQQGGKLTGIGRWTGAPVTPR